MNYSHLFFLLLLFLLLFFLLFFLFLLNLVCSMSSLRLKTAKFSHLIPTFFICIFIFFLYLMSPILDLFF